MLLTEQRNGHLVHEKTSCNILQTCIGSSFMTQTNPHSLQKMGFAILVMVMMLAVVIAVVVVVFKIGQCLPE